jgi:hypothetical protein
MKKLKRMYPAAMAFVAIIFGGYALYRNPSTYASHKSFEIMRSDMHEILSIGGTIDYSYESDKYGGASLMLGVLAGSVPAKIRERQRITLRNLGWRSLNKSEDHYCKNGILYYTEISKEKNYDKPPIRIMAMQFDAQTIDDCASTNVPMYKGDERTK